MSDSEYHEMYVVRRAPVADPGDLVKPVDRLVRGVEAEGPGLYRLFGYSPAFHLYPVLGGEKDLVEAFLMTSEIQWHHGRALEDPTHQLVFFNDTEEPSLQVYVRIEFVATGAESTGAGLIGNLRLGTEAVAYQGADRTDRLDRLFDLLIDTLQPDFGHVQLPGHPTVPKYEDPPGWPNTPDIGWLTYLARPKAAGPPAVPGPSVVVRRAAGVKIYAAPPPTPVEYAGVAEPIMALRRTIAAYLNS